MKELYLKKADENLPKLNENIVIHRVNGDAPRENLIEPKWSLKKLVVMNEIDKIMKTSNLYQGMNVKKSQRF